MELINKEAVRLLHILGKKEVTRVTTTVGPEQEYFLVDRALSYKRKDILFAPKRWSFPAVATDTRSKS